MANERLGLTSLPFAAPVRPPPYMMNPAVYGIQSYSGGMQVPPQQSGPSVTDTLLGMLGSGGAGILFGTLQSELKNGLDYGGKIPIDAVISALAMFGGVAYGSHSSVRFGQNAFAIYTFRQTTGLLTMLRGMVAGKPPTVVTPDLTQDPLADAEKDL